MSAKSEKKKKSTMVYLNRENVKQAKLLNLNISQIAGSALEYVLKHSEFQPVYTEIVLLQQDINRVKTDISMKKHEIGELESRLVQLEQRKNILDNQLSISQRDTRIAKLFAQLRDIAATYNYNIDKVLHEGRQVIKSLAEEGIEYTRKDLEVFIERIRS